MMKDAKKSDGHGAWPLPMTSLFRIEIDPHARGFCALLSGIVGIEEYADGRVLLKTDRGTLLLLGHGLSLTVLENRRAQIVGRIREVRLLDRHAVQ